MYATNLQVTQVFSFLETILPKFRRWPIFLLYVLLRISPSTECKGSMQSIIEWRSWQREQLIQEIMERDIIVVVMVSVSPQGTLPRICDKRHNGLASSNMERQALQIACQRLKQYLSVADLLMDDSSSIKMIGKLFLLKALNTDKLF